jgi:Rod binding domain-containing protein
MDGIKLHKGPIALQSSKPDPLKKPDKLEETVEKLGKEFELIFARQLVEQMTKDAFKPSDNSTMQAGSEIYRTQITDSLASELARNGNLGIAKMLQTNWQNPNRETT